MNELPNETPVEKLEEKAFLDHLEDLRSILIQTVIVFLTVSIGCWFLSAHILDLLIKDLPVDSLYFQTPIEAFTTRLKISFVVGFMLAFPFILFRVWSFVAPGLFVHERKRVWPIVISSTVLFYVGVMFCYWILIPVVLGFLLGFGTEFLNPLLSVGSYFAFVARLCFTFGVVFQIPIVVLLLSSLGLVTPRWLLKQWRYGVLLIFVTSAILTPPDPVSLMIMALPVLGLYIGSILIAFVGVRRREEDSYDVDSIDKSE